MSSEVDQEVVTYTTADSQNFHLHLFYPSKAANGRRPGIVFFHGWGKTMGPDQFFPQCRYLATRGMVAGSAEYRVRRDSAADYLSRTLVNARAAVRWMRANAERLQLDPERLAAAGGSGGGWAAASTAIIEEATGPEGVPTVSPRPNALILFNPVVRFRKDSELSPANWVRPGLPPTIIFHGTDDELIPIESIEEFCLGMKRTGNRCDLRKFPGERHAFFNYEDGRNRPYYETLLMADEFLAALGFLAGPPTLNYEDLIGNESIEGVTPESPDLGE